MKPSFKRLAIDTATDHLYLSVIIDDQEKGNVWVIGNQDHSVRIMPLMEELLQAEGLKLQDLDEVIVGVGPGSYTGVRIGVSIAKMIGYLNSCQVSKVSSLALLASSSQAERIVPFLDARRGNAFLATFHQQNQLLQRLQPDVLENVEHYLSQLKSPIDIVKVGKPDILKVLRSGLTEVVENVHELVPEYLQITEAERHLRAQ